MKKFYLTRDEKKAIPFILPGVAVTALLIIYPLFYIISMSFSENAIGQNGFAGLTNYLRLFKNPMFTSSIWNTLVWTLGTVIPASLCSSKKVFSMLMFFSGSSACNCTE